jgi:hypothetical protein
MRSRRIVRRSFLLSSFITFLLLACSPTLAGTINVLGFVDIGPGFPPVGGLLNLGGDRGFTLNGSAEFFLVGPSIECFGVSITCSPGTTISLNAGSSGLEVTASATLDGRSIPQVGGICVGSSTPPCAFPGFEFRGQAVVPPFGDFTKAIVKAPVDFSGFLNLDSPGGQNTLVASAIATLTLDKIEHSGGGFPGPAWQYDGIRYELEPIPEPTTLLLFGTTAAGIGLARWRRRKPG